jgi:M6 family metalloprotease-like protein
MTSLKTNVATWIAALILLSASSVTLAGVPYRGETYNYRQPNGEVLKITLDGNSYYAEQRTSDGSLVVYDPALHGLAYARVNAAGTDLESTGVLATNTQMRAKGMGAQHGLSAEARRSKALQHRQRLLKSGVAPASGDATGGGSGGPTNNSTTPTPVTGRVVGLTVIIQFPDQAGTMTQQQIVSFLNDMPYSSFGNAQSIRGYYSSVSGGKLDYVNTTSAYYTAKHNKSYYTDGTVTFPSRAQELMLEALNWMKASNFDFTTLTTDANKRILGMNFLYAGETDSAWSTGLWPHMGTFDQPFCSGSICTYKYQISNMGTSLSIGTFVHESGHLLFSWPDLYDYDGSSDGSVAAFDIMGYGGAGTQNKYRPTPPNGFFRYRAGWDTLTELNPAVSTYAPKGPLSNTSESHTLYRYSNPANPGEAFYLETIYKAGQDTYQPAQGLAVYHVDPAGDNSDEWHPFVQMEHADGARDPEYKRNTGDATDLYDGVTYRSFNDTTPNNWTSRGTNSKWWNATSSGLNVHDISPAAPTVSFNVGTGSTSTGYLYDQQSSPQPWFYYSGGSLAATMTGPASPVDFDLQLEWWNGNSWQVVASSTGPTTSEALRYNAGAGYYRVTPLSYSGAGYYTLTVYK